MDRRENRHAENRRNRPKIKKLTKKQLNYLHRLYSTPSESASFSSPYKLYQEIKSRGKYKISLGQIKNYLSKQESYTLTKNVKESSNKPHYVSYFKYYLLQTDLVNMVSYAKKNDNVMYLLTVIDTFSKYLWIRPIKNRKGKTVADNFENILEEINENILYLCSDRGIEYKAQEWLLLMERHNIKHYYSTTGGCAGIERVHRTIKSKIAKYMYMHNTERYIDVLPKLVQSYNKTVHSTTLKKPRNVNISNQYEVYLHIKNNQKKFKKKRFLFNIGDTVKISLKRTVYDRELSQKFSKEFFEIAHRYRNQSINLYKLRDCTKDVIFGSFYEYELQKYIPDPKKTYIIDKVVKREENRSLVTFKDFPSKCKEWVENTKIKTFANQEN